MTAKEQLQKLVEKLPDDANLEQIQEQLHYQLYVLQKVELGTKAGEEGRVKTHEEVRRRFGLE